MAARPNVIGRQVRVNGQPATIVGVMPNGFRFPNGVDHMDARLCPRPSSPKRDNRRIMGYGILKPGVSSPARPAASSTASPRRLALQYPTVDKDIGASVETFHQRFNGGGIRVIFLLMLAAVGFVLIIACADVANMMLSRALGPQARNVHPHRAGRLTLASHPPVAD